MTLSKEERRARLSQEVEGWRPEPGDEVYGEIVSVGEQTGDYGDYPYLEVDDEDTGKVIGVHAFHSVLKRELANKSPNVGDEIGIHYFGKKKTKSGTEFEHYKVDVYRADGSRAKTPNWEDVAQEADSEMDDEISAAFPGATEEDSF